MYTLPRHGMRHLGRIDEPSISCDQDILYGKKEFVAKPSEKKMMMKRKMRRLEAKPEHESRSIQRVSSRCKWTNNYQYLMYKFILTICNPIRCFENLTYFKVMLILNNHFYSIFCFNVIIWLVLVCTDYTSLILKVIYSLS